MSLEILQVKYDRLIKDCDKYEDDIEILKKEMLTLQTELKPIKNIYWTILSTLIVAIVGAVLSLILTR